MRVIDSNGVLGNCAPYETNEVVLYRGNFYRGTGTIPGQWERVVHPAGYLGTFANKTVLDTFLNSTPTQLGDYGIIQNTSGYTGLLDSSGTALTGPAFFVMVTGALYGVATGAPSALVFAAGHLGGGVGAIAAPAPPTPWLMSYLFKDSPVLGFAGEDGDPLGGFFQDLAQIDGIWVTFQDAGGGHGPRYQLEAYFQRDSNNYTDAYYYSDNERDNTTYILDPTQGGETVDGVQVGPPIAPNRFNPAIGFFNV